jgi:hypothetical protein
MLKPLICCLAIIIALASCATSYHYNFSLFSVDRPNIASEKYGPVKIEKDGDNSVAARYRFSDSLVEILFSINSEQIELVLKNKTSHSIKIDWEKSAYINPYGARKRVIHSGIKYERKADPQMPSIIRKGETRVDFLVPSENVNVYLYGSGGFTVYPLFSGRDFGKNARVILPLEVDGAFSEYCFQFKINVEQ